MKDPEAVIIDVRNAYESAIGNFQPPKGGATLIDPKMRNSIEFPKWLNSEETQKKLTGKKVLVSDLVERNGVSAIFCKFYELYSCLPIEMHYSRCIAQVESDAREPQHF